MGIFGTGLLASSRVVDTQYLSLQHGVALGVNIVGWLAIHVVSAGFVGFKSQIILSTGLLAFKPSGFYPVRVDTWHWVGGGGG